MSTVGLTDLDQSLQDYAEEFKKELEGLDELVEVLYPNRDDLLAAAGNGHEIASHGRSHFRRDKLTDDEFEAELVNSKRELSNLLGQEIQSFSYPFNSFFERDKTVCAQHYNYVATVEGGFVSRQTLLTAIPRCTNLGTPKSSMRQRRWLLTGRI